MSLFQISIFAVFALLVALLRRGLARIALERRAAAIRWLLLATSVLAIYWMQPAMPIRHLDFWLPTATLGITVLVWAATREKREKRQIHEKNKAGEKHEKDLEPENSEKREKSKENWWGAVVLGGMVLLSGITRYLPQPACCIGPTAPPELWKIILTVGALGLAALGLLLASSSRRLIAYAAMFALLGVFIVLKTEPLAQAAAAGLRQLSGQSTRLASALDIRWLGFSYVAFRLIHTLRDRLNGRLPTLSLPEFVSYIIFFPAITAGPIDRVQHFTQEYRKLEALPIAPGGQRILWGIFKKFAIADTLALIALNATNAGQVKSGLWLWVLLYAYALRIYFDFSGYTDIAIGLGKLMGINLPENFDRPYLKPNLTTFWNSWHITLAQWFRAYFFNPLTRAMRSAGRKYPLWLVVLAGQFSTMLLIGLWHGVTWNFAAWGAWHGVGLFVHSRWTEATRTRLAGLAAQPALQRTATTAGVLVTFHYVALGWVWFALPSMQTSGRVLLRLLGA